MKILILTDSLGLPRIKPEVCSFEKTWPVLLKERYPNIHQVSIGSATTDTLLKQINYHKHFQPDIVVIQVGIVDCAPRFMSRLELEITKSLGLFGKALIKLANRKWIRNLRNITYVKQTKFKKNINSIQDAFNCPVIFIGIIPATKEYEELLPGVSYKIQTYNSILEKKSNYFVKTNKISIEGGLMTDHHHINTIGHEMLFERIIKTLNEIKVP